LEHGKSGGNTPLAYLTLIAELTLIKVSCYAEYPLKPKFQLSSCEENARGRISDTQVVPAVRVNVITPLDLISA
jgi:hypothetical protein